MRTMILERSCTVMIILTKQYFLRFSAHRENKENPNIFEIFGKNKTSYFVLPDYDS